MKVIKDKFKDNKFLINGAYRYATELTQEEIEGLIETGFSKIFQNSQGNQKRKRFRMIFLQRRTVDSLGNETPKLNTLFVTLSERLSANKLSNYLLIVLTSDQQHTVSKTVLQINSSDVTLDERIDKIKITEGESNKETTTGTVKINPAGFFYYKIYEQTSSTNLTETDSSIVKLLEQGKMTVTDTDELTTVQHTNPTTNFIHINS